VSLLSQNDFFKMLNKGDQFSTELVISEDLGKKFGQLSGDLNPLHTSDDFAIKRGFNAKLCYGNILGCMVSKMVGMNLGSDDVMLISQKIDFNHPVYNGNTITLIGEVVNKSEAVRVVDIVLSFFNENKMKVGSGRCQVKVFNI